MERGWRLRRSAGMVQASGYGILRRWGRGRWRGTEGTWSVFWSPDSQSIFFPNQTAVFGRYWGCRLVQNLISFGPSPSACFSVSSNGVLVYQTGYPLSELRASQEVRTLAPSKLWSPSADSIQSPREWVATAHPLGKHVPQTADKPKERKPNIMFNKAILIGRLGQNAEAKTAQNNKEYVTLNIATQESRRTTKANMRIAPSGTASTPEGISRSSPRLYRRGSSSPSDFFRLGRH
jgi:hypothetical protein